MRTLLFTIVTLLSISQASAKISLTRVNDCICEGEPIQAFELIVEGNAGPFTIEWAGPNGYTSTEKNPTDMHLAGQYSVTITNAYRCSMTLYENLPACLGLESLSGQPCSSSFVKTKNQQASFSANAKPNPFKNEFSLSLESVEMIDINLVILNSVGEKVKESNFPSFEGKWEHEIVLGDKSPPGLYVVVLTTSNGQKEVLKLVHMH